MMYQKVGEWSTSPYYMWIEWDDCEEITPESSGPVQLALDPIPTRSNKCTDDKR